MTKLSLSIGNGEKTVKIEEKKDQKCIDQSGRRYIQCGLVRTYFNKSKDSSLPYETEKVLML